MVKVSVIVAGAGTGKRFGAEENKIFHRLGDRPLFVRTLEVFVSRRDVCQVLLAVAAGDVDAVKRHLESYLGSADVTVVTGGPTRSQSVRNALARLSDQAELVCVHDAVRPCISPLWVDEVFAQAERTGAAILAWPVHGTLKRVSADGLIEETLARSEVWEAQTPQVFRRDLLLAAYGRGGEATDDARLVEAMGRPVSVVRGDPRNIKITTAADLALAAAVIDSLPSPKPVPPATLLNNSNNSNNSNNRPGNEKAAVRVRDENRTVRPM
jgi:2-C-methyl-D-erythritol 4-phosphate cytidylyltransferase